LIGLVVYVAVGEQSFDNLTGIAGVCPPDGPRARAVAAAAMIVPASAAPQGSRAPHHPDLP